MQFYYHPAITIFVCALQGTAFRSLISKSKSSLSNLFPYSKCIIPLLISTVLYFAFPPHSIVASYWYHLTTTITKSWPYLVTLFLSTISKSKSSNDDDDNKNNNDPATTITTEKKKKKKASRHHRRNNIDIGGGPLGTNYYKPIQVLSGIVLWKLCRQNRYPPIYLLASTSNSRDGSSTSGSDTSSSSSSSWMPSQYKWPSSKQWIVVIGISIGVNMVLFLWSKLCNTTGDHAGVNNMVRTKMNRKLTLVEHIHMIMLAFINAICEEVTSRGLWRIEFQLYGSLNQFQSNIGQALVFGIWHYNGIPSGYIGVLLTTVYGFIMGLLADSNHGGLLMPIVTHTIADYFIFSYIARQQLNTIKTSSSLSNNNKKGK